MLVGYTNTINTIGAHDKTSIQSKKLDILTATIKTGDNVSLSEESLYLAVSQQIGLILQSEESAAKKAKAIRDYMIVTINILRNRKGLMGLAISLIQDIVTDIINNDDLQTELIKLAQFEYNTYEHSVNVGLLGIAFMLANKVEKKRIIPIGTCMVLHDIGKLDVPLSIIEKVEALTEYEYELIKLHPSVGYDNVISTHLLDDESCRIILEHHENIDGSGYPHGLKSPHISYYAQICAIIDRFHAMGSIRPYREPMPREKVVKILREEVLRGKINGDLLEIFLKFL